MKEHPVFHWDDPLRMERELSEVERGVQAEARAFAQEYLAPRVIAASRTEEFDPAVMREMGIRRLLGIDLNGYGFRGLNHVCYGLVAREIERVDSGYRTIFSVQSSLAAEAIYGYGSEEQKEKYLPRLGRGELIACFGLTEPEHGSDPGGMQTRARKVPGGYELDGHKKWIGLATIADILIVWAKNEADVVNGFILERDAPGLSVSLIRGKCSLRTSPTCEFTMNRVQVGEDRRLPKARGLSAPFSCLNKARFGIAWGALGAAEACWHAARDYVIRRKQFGRPLAANQLIQKKLADMQTEVALLQQSVLRLGRLMDAGECPHEVISLMKRCSAKKALEIALAARDMLGANGILDEYHVIRHVMNLMTVTTYEGTDDVHALVLGKAQTGISAFC